MHRYTNATYLEINGSSKSEQLIFLFGVFLRYSFGVHRIIERHMVHSNLATTPLAWLSTLSFKFSVTTIFFLIQNIHLFLTIYMSIPYSNMYCFTSLKSPNFNFLLECYYSHSPILIVS